MKDPFIYYDNFASEMERIQRKLYIDIQRSLEGFDTQTEMFQTISQIDFFQRLQGQGLETAISRYLDSLDLLVLEQLQAKGGATGVNLEVFDVMQKLQANVLLQRAEMFSSEFKYQLLNGIITGKSTKDIRANLLPRIQEQVVYLPNWFNSMMSTAHSQYSATLLTEIWGDDENAKYELIGPYDERTRPSCIHALEIQKKNPDGFTKEEIDNGALGQYEFKGKMYNYDFNRENLFNCRHYFTISDSYLKG
jgi:hypothetical protein